MSHVLVIEDNPDMSALLHEYFGALGYQVTAIRDGRAGLHAALHTQPDLIVLDVMLPGLGGLEVLRRLRVESDALVLMLTARESEADKVLALELGADDYVTKPFSIAELLARVKALLRRTQPSGVRGPLQYGILSLHPMTREVLIRGQPVLLTRKEFDLLLLFVLNPQRVFNRTELLAHLQEEGSGSESTINVHMRNLRTKLEGAADLLETVYGVGYRLREAL